VGRTGALRHRHRFTLHTRRPYRESLASHLHVIRRQPRLPARFLDPCQGHRRDIFNDLRLVSNDFDILEEILIKASILNPQIRLGEVPVTFGRRKAGESKRKLVQFAFGYLKTLKRLRSFAAAARKEKELA